MVINLTPTPWRIAQALLRQPQGGQRIIRGGPVFDLDVLQSLVTDGVLGEDMVWVANTRCERDLENYRWDYAEVLHMITCLKLPDFRGSTWCQVKGGEMYPCDDYRFLYDCDRRERNVRGLEVYVKFSVNDDGQLTLVLVSCHGSR